MKRAILIAGAILFCAACSSYKSSTSTDNITAGAINTGYGMVSQADNTYSVDHKEIKTSDLSGYTDILDYLRGRCPGVEIGYSQGGAMPSVTIRGIHSLTLSSQALFVVDGAVMENIMGLNPNDVYSVDVLKDGASSSIYGARGSNGVIVITTKSGHNKEVEEAAVRKAERKAKRGTSKK